MNMWLLNFPTFAGWASCQYKQRNCRSCTSFGQVTHTDTQTWRMIQLLHTSCNYIVWMWKWKNSGCWCGHGREASASVVPQHDFNVNQIPREFTRRQGMWSIVNPWLATKWWRQLKDSDGWSNTTHDQYCFSIGSRLWTILWLYPFCEQRIEWDGISCTCAKQSCDTLAARTCGFCCVASLRLGAGTSRQEIPCIGRLHLVHCSANLRSHTSMCLGHEIQDFKVFLEDTISRWWAQSF